MTTTNITNRPEAEAVAAIVREHLQPQLIFVKHPTDESVGEVPLLVSTGRDGNSIACALTSELDAYRPHPKRRAGVATLYDLESFIAHTNRFKSDASALFADPNSSGPHLTSVLDYHPGGDGAPAWRAHRGLYECPLSAEWKRWTGQAGKGMTPAQFAEFLEANITDLADPSGKLGATAQALAAAAGIEFAPPARILELSRGLSVRATSLVKEAKNLATGEVNVAYVTEHQDERGQPLKVPGGFLIAVPVFRGGAAYKVPVRLRYRLRESQITWFFELYQAERFFDDAFAEACKKAQEATGLPLFQGQPE